MNNSIAYCPYCSTPYNPASDIPCCVNCAKPLPKGEITTINCPTCGAPIPSGLQSCPACGAAFVPNAASIIIPEPPKLTAQLPDLPTLPTLPTVPDLGAAGEQTVEPPKPVSQPAPAPQPAMTQTVQAPAPQPAKAPTYQPPMAQTVQAPIYQPAAPAPKKSGSKKSLVIGLSLAAAALAAFIIFIIPTSSISEGGSTSSVGGTSSVREPSGVLTGENKTAYEYIIASKDEFKYPESIEIIGGSLASDGGCLFSNIRYKNADGDIVEELYYFDKGGWCLPQEEDIYPFYKYTDELDLDAINAALEDYYS